MDQYGDRHVHSVAAGAERLWQVIEGIGGTNGWYSPAALWAARGLIDRAVGGIGLRPGRTDPQRLRVGDPVDFWRVESVRPPAGTEPGLLRLRAEMKMPGTAWLQMGAESTGTTSRYTQESIFEPDGLAGRLYWVAEWPLHMLVFTDMARNIVRAAERPPDTGHIN